MKVIARNPSDADSAMGTVTTNTTISRENSSRLSLPSIHYNHEEMKNNFSKLTPKNSFQLKNASNHLKVAKTNSCISKIHENENNDNERVPRKFLRSLNMTPNQIEMLTRQDKLGESSTIKMSYKFAVTENQTSLNNMVKQLGSVESLFESPECIAELIAKQGEQADEMVSGGENEEEATNL